MGFVAALLADADALIQSSTDPLLTLEYHLRHYTLEVLENGLAMTPNAVSDAATVNQPALAVAALRLSYSIFKL